VCLHRRYDQLGNRKQKLDSVGNGRKTVYTYDTDFTTENSPDPDFITRNNRLLWYVESIGDGQSGWTPVRTVKYTYYVTGDVSNITVKDNWTGVGSPPAEYSFYYDLALYYTEDHKLWRALWDKWQADGQGQPDPETYQRLSAREFYYDSGRQRYLDRDVDPDTWQLIGAGRWTDYAGQQPYADFTHTGLYQELPTEQTSYFAGHAQQTVSTGDTAYRHADLIGSTMLATDDCASAIATLAYTAFGEPITQGGVGVPPANFGTRYQYAGAHGYESGLLTLQGPNTALRAISVQHVGARWYDPSVGRFIQRDPVGFLGGVNCYVYCQLDPIDSVDPFGLRNDWGLGDLPKDFNPGPPLSPEVWADILLNLTGGPGWVWIDPVGTRMRTRQSPTGNVLALGGLRLPKGAPIPGLPSTTSVWTKVPGVGLRGGQMLGRFFLPITLCMGFYDWWNFIDATIREWQ
jgi:RHS repeat-associated protein